MTYFLKNGDCYHLASEDAMDMHTSLPVGNYIVKFNEVVGQFYLEKVDQFSINHKIYGSINKNADRILSTYKDRVNSTGALFVGEKGSGKTLLTKLLSINCAKENIPTIIINSPWVGDTFNRFLQQVEQPCMILFDEFEKVYSKEQQESILTLLDGVYPSKKLFIITCNDVWRIDSHMKNRPGRIFYLLEFKSLEEQFVKEYCQDNLKDQKWIFEICRISKIFNKFNFDMLTALVQEVNRYGESPIDSLEILNIKPSYEGDSKYETFLLLNDKVVKDKYPSEVMFNPASNSSITIYDNDHRDAEEDARGYTFQPNDLKKFDLTNEQFIFEFIDKTDKVTLMLKRPYVTYKNILAM